jgi:hypothetical protein
MRPEDTLSELDKANFMKYGKKLTVVEKGKTPATEDLDSGEEFVQEFSRDRYP